MATVVHERRKIDVAATRGVGGGPAKSSRLYRIGGIAADPQGEVASIIAPKATSESEILPK